jgi:RNA polymerase sigma factor (sigma-70 family)
MAMQQDLIDKLDQLASRIKQGDEAAWTELHRVCWGPLVRRIQVLYWAPKEDIEDCAQEVFIRAFMKLDSYSGPGFWFWLLTIATYVAKECRRKREREEQAQTVLLDQKFYDELLARSRRDSHIHEYLHELDKAWRTDLLSDKEWEVLLLGLTRFTIAEIARLRDESEDAVKRRRSRARRKLAIFIER